MIKTHINRETNREIKGYGQEFDRSAFFDNGSPRSLSDNDVQDILKAVVSAHGMVRNAPLSSGIRNAIRSQELFVEEVFKMRAERMLQGFGAPLREMVTGLSPEQELARTVEDLDPETIASMAQNITESLWWDKFDASGDRFGGLMSGNGLGLLQSINNQNTGQGNVFMRENCGRYPTFDGSCNHPKNGGK